MEQMLKICLKIIILLNFITRIFSACNLKYSNSEWIDEWRVLLTKDQSNQYQLLREHNVEENQKIFLLCNSEPKLITATCKSDHKFSIELPAKKKPIKKNKKKPTKEEPKPNIELPLKEKCSANSALQPVTVEMKSKYCPYTLYKIGFNIEINKDKQFVEMYQVCFDKDHLRPVFTINKAYPVGVGRNIDLKFFPDLLFYGNFFNAFNRGNTFQRFQTLLGNTQIYMSASKLDHVIDRGHLTPSADFTLTNFKRSTFNMINAMPQFKTIDNGNWRLIEEWTRHSSRSGANVCTGVLDCKLEGVSDYNCVLKLKIVKDQRRPTITTQVPMFLADKNKIPIPLWSYKIVKSKGNSIVFLTLNNIYHKGNVEVPKKVCVEVNCPLNLVKTVKNGWTFCCDYNEFVAKNVPYLKDVC